MELHRTDGTWNEINANAAAFGDVRLHRLMPFREQRLGAPGIVALEGTWDEIKRYEADLGERRFRLLSLLDGRKLRSEVLWTSPITRDEYFAIEAATDFRSEYISGEMIFAVYNRRQAQIKQNLWFKHGRTLHPDLEMLPDLRVKADTAAYLYPDVAIYHGRVHVENAHEAGETMLNPTVVFEVFSKSTTESYDRGEKFFLYRQIESLTSYVLVSEDEPRVEWHSKQSDGRWLRQEAVGLSGNVYLADVDHEWPLSDIYEDVRFVLTT
jgi:Uma2 family endonuclease